MTKIATKISGGAARCRTCGIVEDEAGDTIEVTPALRETMDTFDRVFAARGWQIISLCPNCKVH